MWNKILLSNIYTAALIVSLTISILSLEVGTMTSTNMITSMSHGNPLVLTLTHLQSWKHNDLSTIKMRNFLQPFNLTGCTALFYLIKRSSAPGSACSSHTPVEIIFNFLRQLAQYLACNFLPNYWGDYHFLKYFRTRLGTYRFPCHFTGLSRKYIKLPVFKFQSTTPFCTYWYRKNLVEKLPTKDMFWLFWHSP